MIQFFQPPLFVLAQFIPAIVDMQANLYAAGWPTDALAANSNEWERVQ